MFRKLSRVPGQRTSLRKSCLHDASRRKRLRAMVAVKFNRSKALERTNLFATPAVFPSSDCSREHKLFATGKLLNDLVANPCSRSPTLNRCYVVSVGRFPLRCIHGHDTRRRRFGAWNWQLTLSPAYNRISRNA